MASRTDPDRQRFEQALLADINRPRYRYRPRGGVWAGTVLLLLLAGGAAGVLGFGVFDVERSSLKRGASLLAACLIQGDCERLLPLFPESEEGGALLALGDAQLFGSVSVLSDYAGSADERMAELQSVRDELERIGLTWATARVVGIGGVRARLSSPKLMNGEAAAFAGYIYFASNGRLFAVEVASRLCDGQWVFLDLSSCREVFGTPADAKSDSEQVYAAFRSEPESREDEFRFASARHIFIPVR